MKKYLKELNLTMHYEDSQLELKESDFFENPELRQHIKLLLNSALGKFNQKEKRIRSCFIRTTKDIERLLQDETEITNLNDISDTICHVNYRTTFKSRNRRTNPTVLAFITAKARVFLHKKIIYLSKEGFKPYYCDTDSILYSGPPNQPSPLKYSLAFGDFKQELGENSIITKFEAYGRKNFLVTYKDKTGNEPVKTLMKVCGMSLQSKIVQDEINEASIRKEKNPKISQIRHIFNKDISVHLPSHKYLKLNNVYLRCERKIEEIDAATVPWGY